jgi:hypothetical protein
MEEDVDRLMRILSEVEQVMRNAKMARVSGGGNAMVEVLMNCSVTHVVDAATAGAPDETRL